MDTIKTIAISAVIVGAFFFLFGFVGLPKHEKMECEQWETESQQFADWYSTDWQKEQCLTYGIELLK